MSDRYEIRIPEKTKVKFFKTAKRNKSVPSKILRKLIENYINGQSIKEPPKAA